MDYLNNDGLKDIHFTNGIGRDFINSDFLQFAKNVTNNTTGDPVVERKLMNENWYRLIM